MLSQITLSNFFSLRDQSVLDMKAINNRAFKNLGTQGNVFLDDNIMLLKSVAIFGANASGKSNMLKAIDACLRYIRDSHSYSELTPPQFEPFKFDDSLRPSNFEIEFTVDGVKYEYGFSIMANRVTEEYLYSYPKKYKALVFKRKINTEGEYVYEFSKKFTRPKEVVASTSKYTLFLTRAALMNRSEAIKALNFFSNCIVVGLPSFEDSVFELMLQTHKDTIINALRYADSDIVDYEFKASADGVAAKRLITYHKSNITKPFDFETEESAGTRRLIRLLTAFIDAADNGKVLIVDELETSLHPQLVKYAVKMFNQSENAQIIFTTHDLDLLNVDILRADQIYFTSKDYESGSTDFYSLVDFSDYKNFKNLRRDYEQGRFDAIPILPTV